MVRNVPPEYDEYPELTQADMDRAKFRIGFKPATRKQRITILLDTGVIEYFKAKAGASGYQSLINDALRQVKDRDSLEDVVRRVVREELRRK
ncbi:MAG: BrnA antitoxin family protein [Candidatus Hydrogenedentes bacterium]|nr:BrnA antitoxin family protein [Candidatus Hydrogenedentota bacterium]